MKSVIYSALFVAVLFVFSSCTDDNGEDSSSKGLQGFWKSKNSGMVVTLLKIDDNTISTYQIDYDPAFMSAGKLWNDYVYDSKTGKITVYIQTVPFYGEVLELSSTTLTWKSEGETESYSRVSYSGDYAPSSLVGKTIGVGSYNFHMLTNTTSEIVFNPITSGYSTLMDAPTYSYRKTAANTATVSFGFGEKLQIMYDSYTDDDVVATLELVFDTPNVGYVKSGSFVYEGTEYQLVDYQWKQKGPHKMTIDYSNNYFVLK